MLSWIPESMQLAQRVRKNGCDFVRVRSLDGNALKLPLFLVGTSRSGAERTTVRTFLPLVCLHTPFHLLPASHSWHQDSSRAPSPGPFTSSWQGQLPYLGLGHLGDIIYTWESTCGIRGRCVGQDLCWGHIPTLVFLSHFLSSSSLVTAHKPSLRAPSSDSENRGGLG